MNSYSKRSQISGLAFGESSFMLPDSRATAILLRERDNQIEKRKIEAEKESKLKQEVSFNILITELVIGRGHPTYE